MAMHLGERTEYAFRKLMRQVIVMSSGQPGNLAWLTDISPKECCLKSQDSCFALGDNINFNLCNYINISGIVMGGECGKFSVVFHSVIPQEKFQSLCEQLIAVPIAPGAGFFDNFGRKLPKLIRSTR